MGTQDLWVFGYGSLMWRPGFRYEESGPAKLFGYHRSFCVYSHYHRGTPQKPGLVFGLDRGGSCRGVAYRVAAKEAESVRAYLRAREQVTSVYLESERQVELLDGSGHRTPALCFLIDRQHEQYAGKLPMEEQVQLVIGGHGKSGRNPEYLRETLGHLLTMGIEDAGLQALWAAVDARLSDGLSHSAGNPDETGSFATTGPSSPSD